MTAISKLTASALAHNLCKTFSVWKSEPLSRQRPPAPTGAQLLPHTHTTNCWSPAPHSKLWSSIHYLPLNPRPTLAWLNQQPYLPSDGLNLPSPTGLGDHIKFLYMLSYYSFTTDKNSSYCSERLLIGPTFYFWLIRILLF